MTTRRFVLILSVLLLANMSAVSLAESPPIQTQQIYIEKVMNSQYFHADSMCPGAAEWFLPMKPLDRTALSQECYGYLRPCLICAPEDYEAYLRVDAAIKTVP